MVRHVLVGSAGASLLALAFAACGTEELTDPPIASEASDAAAVDSASPPPSGDAGPTPPASDAGEDAADADAPVEQNGEATYYNAEGLGSCGVPFPSDYLVAAMNQSQYQKSDCGKCVFVTGPKGTVTVRILDLCPGCKPGGLDLSETAFKKIADLSAGRVPITWHFVDCPF